MDRPFHWSREGAPRKEAAEAHIRSQVHMQVTICTHSPSRALSEMRCHAPKGRLSWSMVLPLLFAAIASQVAGQQMQIKRNQFLVLQLGAPVGEMEEFEGVLAYRSLIQEVPFIEVHLIRPVPAKRLNRGRMIFSCEEVGIYTDASKRTWTTGKRCKLR